MNITPEQIDLMRKYAFLLEKYLLAYRSDLERGDEDFPAWLNIHIARKDERHIYFLLKVYDISLQYTESDKE